MAGIRSYTGYDPDVVARNLYRLGDTVSNTVQQGNQHKIDMANLGLARSRQEYAQGNRTRELDAQLAESEYGKRMKEVVPLSAFLKENNMDPERHRKTLAEIGEDIDAVMVPRGQGVEMLNALMKESRGVKLDEKNFGRQTPKDAAMTNLYQAQADEIKRGKVTAAQEKEQNRILDSWKKSRLDVDLKSAGFVVDKNGNYAKVGPPDFEGKPTLIPANDEAAQVLLKGQLYDNAIALAKAEGTTPDAALTKIVQMYKAQREEAIRKAQIGGMGKPDVAGLSAAVAARNPKPVPVQTPQNVHPITQAINSAYGGIGKWNEKRKEAADRIRNLQ